MRVNLTNVLYGNKLLFIFVKNKYNKLIWLIQQGIKLLFTIKKDDLQILRYRRIYKIGKNYY